MFRVRAVNRQGESAPLQSSEPVIAKDPFGKPEKPGTPQVVGKLPYKKIVSFEKEQL